MSRYEVTRVRSKAMTIIEHLRSIPKRIRYYGSQRYCAVCERSSNQFLPFGVNPRPDARCPWCGTLERDRLAISFLRARTALFEGQSKDFLHVAPEPAFATIFSNAAGDGYLSADLLAEHVMEKMDITDIRHPDESFDAIYCSHVLEHVPDDRKAMREFYRVLRPSGWAILNVPITADETFEDPSVTDPKERERLFGQDDHVRRYGPDYKDRLEEAGFHVTVYTPQDAFSGEEIERQGMANGAAGEIYYCTKQPPA